MNIMSAEEIESATTKHTTSEGKLDLPNDMSETDKFLIRHAKRTRDAQGELSKTKNELLGANAATKVLTEKALQISLSDFGLSPEEASALQTLSHRDPEAYRLKMNAMESEAKTNKVNSLNETVDLAKTEASSSFTAKNNIQLLDEFRTANPTVDLSDNVLASDIPPRLIQGYTQGNYDYSTYLSMVKEYVGAGVVIPNPQGGVNLPNLSHAAGATKPGQKAAEAQGKKDYSRMTL